MSIKSIMLLLIASTLVGLWPSVSIGEDKPAPAKAIPNADHREEGEQLLGAARDQSRVQYAKTGTAPKKLTDAGVAIDVFKGKHFSVVDKVYVVGDKGQKAALTAEPVDKNDGFGIITFEWANGNSDIKWYDTFDARKKAHEDVDFGDDEAEEPAGGGDAAEDPLAFYKKVGNFYLTKTTMKFKMGDDWTDYPASFLRMEVTKVDGNKITYKMTTYDADMKETYSAEQPMDLAPVQAPADAAEEAPKATEEEIEVKAGKFTAMKFESESGGAKTVSWTFKGMTVKSTTKSDTIEMTTELQEYKLS